MKALILAGGRGKRLRPLTDKIPKPLIRINKTPLIEWSIKYLKKFGKNCSGHIVDLTDSKHGDETAKEILNIYKSIDIVVNNAGIARNTPAEEISDSEWLEVMDINVNSIYWCCRAFGKIMLSQVGV